ncbi:MAG: FdtA/QdtA family cupin domain-containing protein [Candidatus Riflebacteria bacterium]|nr:FdtA/QdtA family cupin domain-containing protein [Candidatus Riflebacteria bacterium]
METKFYNLQVRGDDRGSLTVVEGNIDIPFEIKRVYYIFQTKMDVRRGFHAHKKLEQIAICVAGSCKFHLDNGRETSEVLLDSPSRGLYVGKMIWREMYDFTPDCVLMVFASEHYSEADYIRNYDDFKAVI